jgi:hypothetical protein
MHKRNTPKLRVEVFLSINTGMFETCRRHYSSPYLDGWTEQLIVSFVKRPANTQESSGFFLLIRSKFYPDMFRHMVVNLRGSWVPYKLPKRCSVLWVCADCDWSCVTSCCGMCPSVTWTHSTTGHMERVMCSSDTWTHHSSCMGSYCGMRPSDTLTHDWSRVASCGLCPSDTLTHDWSRVASCCGMCPSDTLTHDWSRVASCCGLCPSVTWIHDWSHVASCGMCPSVTWNTW